MPDTNIDEDSLTAPGPQSFRQPWDARPERLDKVLARLIPEHSRSRLQGWIEGGHVLVNGVAGRVKQIIGPGDELTVWHQQPPEALAFSPEPVEFDVVDEGENWIVVFKPAGLVTHPGAGNWTGTLLNGLLHRFPELSLVARAGIVHRLDKDTSGLLVVARNEQAQTHLVRQLQARTVSREYIALAHGRLSTGGTVEAPIGRDVRVPVRMSTDRPISPKQAITHYHAQRAGRLDPGGAVTEVICRLETGRTHQIRVHMASIGHPLVADALYGGKELGVIQRQMLHARALSFDEPGYDRRLSFAAEPPQDFMGVLQAVTWES